MTKTHGMVEQYRSCADAGMTIAETAQHLGRAYDTVARAARAHGFRFQPSGVGGIRYTADDWRPLAGLTKGEAAERMGSDYRTVANAARRFGITFQDGREGRA